MTQVSWTKPLGLAAALVVLGTTAYYLEFKRAPEKEEAAENAKKPLFVKDLAVTTLRIVDGKRRYAFRCADDPAKMCKPGDNSKWELVEPIKAKADDSNVNALLSSINNLQVSDTIDLTEETGDKRAKLLREYRLDSTTRATAGARRVELTTGKGEARTLFLGDTHPVGETIFAGLSRGKTDSLAFDEKTVLLVPTHFKSSFDHDLTYWRDKRLLSIASHQVSGFRLDWAKAQVSGERENGQWTLKSKAGEMAGDVESIDSLINAATYLAAKQFVSESKSDPAARKALAGAKKAVTFTLEPEAAAPSGTPSAAKKAEPVVMTFFEKSKKLYATVSTLDPLYELEPTAKDRVAKELKELRMTKLITSMDRFTSKRVEFSGSPIGEPALVFVQAGGKWTLAGSPTGSAGSKEEIDGERLQSLLDKLSGNRIQGFLEGAKIPAGQDRGLKLRLGDDKEPKKRELVFWRSGDRLIARDLMSKRGEAFEVDRAVKDALPWDREFFKKKAAPAAQPSAAPAVKKVIPPHDPDHGHAH